MKKKEVSLEEVDLLVAWSDFLQNFVKVYSLNVLNLWFSFTVPIALQKNILFLMDDKDLRRYVIGEQYRAEVEQFFSQRLDAEISLVLYDRAQAQKMEFFMRHEGYLCRRAEEVYQTIYSALEKIDSDQKKGIVPSVFDPLPPHPLYDYIAQKMEKGDFLSDLPDVVSDAPVPAIPASIAALNETADHPIPSTAPENYNITHNIRPDSTIVSSQILQNEVAGVIQQTQTVAQAFPGGQEQQIELPKDPALLDRELTFENFIVGNSNKLAHAACVSVSRCPAQQFNPLFIWGPSGLGKTHLLQAIIHHCKKYAPKMKLRYVKGEEFTNQMIESITYNRTEQFREQYRQCDMLLIDDIQFIAGRESTQEEFFHTFNALYENQKQIVLTSDRPPKEIQHLEERLRTRFEWGMMADITPPDLELRIAILKKKAEQSYLNIPNDILHFIANSLPSNVRQLEGAIKKIYAHVVLLGNQLTLDTALTCIADLITGSEPVSATVDRIMKKVSEKYELPIDMIKSNRRTKQITTARNVAIYLIREATGMSFPQLGKIFGKDHSTILSSYNNVIEGIGKETPFTLEMKEMMRMIREHQ